MYCSVYNTVLLTVLLTVITRLYVRSPELTQLKTESLYPLTNIFRGWWSQGNRFSPRNIPKGMQPYWPSDFSPYWPSNLRNCKIINVCYFKSIHLCIFFTAAIETHADFQGVRAAPSPAIHPLKQPETSRHLQTDGGPALVQPCRLPAPSWSRHGSRLPTSLHRPAPLTVAPSSSPTLSLTHCSPLVLLWFLPHTEGFPPPGCPCPKHSRLCSHRRTHSASRSGPSATFSGGVYILYTHIYVHTHTPCWKGTEEEDRIYVWNY